MKVFCVQFVGKNDQCLDIYTVDDPEIQEMDLALSEIASNATIPEGCIRVEIQMEDE